ncbi:hypothetical protein AVEN_200175-1, partial [Araneus ventricosus]
MNEQRNFSQRVRKEKCGLFLNLTLQQNGFDDGLHKRDVPK